MNKAELIDAVQKAYGPEASYKQAADAVATMLELIAKAVKKDRVVQLPGFGTFKVAERKARKGRNPKTGAAIKIKASKTVRFTASSVLKKSV